MEAKENWYNNSVVIVVLLFLLFPIGVYLAAVHSDWKTRNKLLVPVLIGLTLIFGYFADREERQQAVAERVQVETEAVTPSGNMQADSPEIREIMVRVSVWNDTEQKKLGERSEIWLRGHGSWWIAPEARFGGTTKNLAKHKTGTPEDLYIYPDGREKGKEIVVPVLLTNDMCPDGCARDMVQIEITDDTVHVFGRPVEEATFPRR